MSAIGVGVLCTLFGMFLFGAQEQAGLIFVVGGFVTLFTGIQKREEQKALKERRVSQLGPAGAPAAQAFQRGEDECRAQDVMRTYSLPAIPVPLSLQPGEFACYREHTTLTEVRTLPRLAGGYMPWEAAPTATDEGELYITNRRIYFSGRRETRDIPLGELATVIARTGTMEVWRRGRPQPTCFNLPFPAEVVAYIERARSTGPAPLPPMPPSLRAPSGEYAAPSRPAGNANPSLVRCGQCGAANGLSANFCQNCAAPIQQGSSPTLIHPGDR